MVERRLWKVVVVGGGGDIKWVIGLFVPVMDVRSRQTPLTVKIGWCELLSNIKAEFVSHQFPLCFHV